MARGSKPRVLGDSILEGYRIQNHFAERISSYKKGTQHDVDARTLSFYSGTSDREEQLRKPLSESPLTTRNHRCALERRSLKTFTSGCRTVSTCVEVVHPRLSSSKVKKY